MGQELDQDAFHSGVLPRSGFSADQDTAGFCEIQEETFLNNHLRNMVAINFPWRFSMIFLLLVTSSII